MDSGQEQDLTDRLDLLESLVDAGSAVDAASLNVCLQRIVTLQRLIGERTFDSTFVRVTQTLALSEREQHVVLLLVATRLRPAFQARMRERTMATEWTLDAIREAIYGETPSLEGHDELSSNGPLRRFGVIERNDDHGPSAHESKQTWTIAPRLLAILLGCYTVDSSVAKLARRREPLELVNVTASHDARELVLSAMASSGIIVVSGMPGLGRRTLLTAAASERRCSVLEVDARRLAKDSLVFVAQLRAIARECRLLERIVLLGNLDSLDDERIELVGSELVALLDGPILVTTGPQRPRIDWGRPTIVIELQQPTSAQRATLWKRALGDIGAQDVDHLATHYPLAPALIARAAEAARARAGARALTAEDVHAGIRAVLDDRVGQYAKRVTVTQSWEDLVLPQEQVDAVTELMARIRERRRVYEDWGFAAKVGKGLGTSALFSGPPGTGKTMVAALIARDLGLELYQVDLGKVVSKYIGETEKNLAALFDAAEAGHAVILFDEADSLFGKRTDVKSSNDRYANLETNYLLQRLESFTGICLLTSNHESNIDPAFMRRLSLHLRFDLPDTAERAQLWRAMLPTAAPVDADVDVERLAQRYAMSGGYIRNAALRAAFLAANEDSAITGAHLERAARCEYEAMGKIATM